MAARSGLVAGVAYLDPGNVASNMTAGARFGYLLVWVVVLGNAMAWLIQYLSAKLGIVTGQSLAETLGERLRIAGRAAPTGCRPSSSRWPPTSPR
jgi:NRAMP (natural resistance-associated macrophage protein)-like metal ion transporter